MRKPLLLILSALSVPATLCLASRDAHAGGLMVGADFNIAVPLNVDAENAGVGVDGRVGYRIGLGPLWLQPEAVGGFQGFGGRGGDSLGRVLGGARFGIGGLIEPNVFAHGGAAFGNGNAGFNFDVGGALDLKISIVYAGVHGAFNSWSVSGGSVSWFDLGPHAGLVF